MKPNFSKFKEIIEKIDRKTDLFGISCSFTKEWENYKSLINALKAEFPDVPIACGGEHVTASPTFSMDECEAIDYIIQGEGEETIVELINALNEGVDLAEVSGIVFRKKGEIITNQRRERLTDINEIPLPAWDLFPIRRYVDQGKSFGVNRGRSMPIIASRGCPYSCTFCSSYNMWTTRWLARTPENVIEEIKKYIQEYNATNFDFYDLTAIVKREWVIDFCKLLQKNQLQITWQLPSGTRSEAIDREVCSYLYRSGCKNISYSPESASPRILRKIKKKISVDKLTESIKSALKERLNVKVNIIFGFPDETHRDILVNLAYIFKLALIGVHDLAIWAFAPYPGSELFNDLLGQGKIKKFDDNYISSLIYSEFNQNISWNDNMSVGWINFYRKIGMLLFYLTNYSVRPMRGVKIITNIIKSKEDSRIEKFILDILKSKLKKWGLLFRGKSTIDKHHTS